MKRETLCPRMKESWKWTYVHLQYHPVPLYSPVPTGLLAVVLAVQSSTSEAKMTEMMSRMMEQLLVMTNLLAKTQASTPSTPTAARPSADAKWVCWGCGKAGHARKLCPSNPWPSQMTCKPAGNSHGPQ